MNCCYYYYCQKVKLVCASVKEIAKNFIVILAPSYMRRTVSLCCTTISVDTTKPGPSDYNSSPKGIPKTSHPIFPIPYSLSPIPHPLFLISYSSSPISILYSRSPISHPPDGYEPTLYETDRGMIAEFGFPLAILTGVSQ